MNYEQTDFAQVVDKQKDVEMENEQVSSVPPVKVAATEDRPRVKSYFQVFCSCTSLHGFQYLGDATRTTKDRLCWAIAVCLSVVTCAYLIFRVYDKWEKSPVIVSFAETTTPVGNIPFPAVTVCSGNKVRKTVFDFMKILNKDNLTVEDFENFGYASIMCHEEILTEYLTDIVDERAVKFIEKTGPPFDKMISKCRWRSNRAECSDLFSSLLTDVGLCHTFNMVNKRELFTDKVDENMYAVYLNHNYSSAEWRLDFGYTTRKSNYPLRALSSGSDEGLSFFYWEWNEDLVDSCLFPAFGFKVLIHSPIDFPQVNTQYVRVPPGYDVVVGVTPNMMTTSEGLLAQLTPKKRQCYMTKERRLHFFKIYTEVNCEFECFINASLKTCNCVSFYMPRAPGTPICGPGSNTCLKRVRASLHHREENETDECRCLPSCTDVQYNVEVSESKVQWDRSIDLYPSEDAIIGRFSIYFKRNRFITSQRNELYGVTDFIANCGGLLGLFMGFSFLSLVEIVYFLIVKPAARIFGLVIA